MTFGLAPATHATDYYWDPTGTTTASGGSGNWDNSSAFWIMGGPTGTPTTFPVYGDPNANAFLQGTAGTLTLTTGVFVNNISVAPTSGTAYTITGAGQTLTLDGAVQSVINVATGNSLSITSSLAGTNGFSLGITASPGTGTLNLDAPTGTSNLLGTINLNGGTLTLGSTTAGDNAASQALRSDAVTLATGTTLTSATQSGTGATADVRIGQLSGSGSVTPGTTGTGTLTGGAINELALGSATFSGAITTNGGFNLRGANGTTQTFTGNVTGLTGTIGINSGSTLVLAGTGDATSGVLGPNTGTTTSIAIRGGTFTLDNSGGNTSATNGRLSSGTAVSALGGTFSLIGSSTGTTQAVGAFTGNAGAANISVTSNSSTAATTLNFGNGTAGTGFSLRGSTSETVILSGPAARWELAATTRASRSPGRRSPARTPACSLVVPVVIRPSALES